MGVSYLKAMALPIKNEKNLEQFFINRFGRELYQTFFKSYTEKVWGTRCDEISAEWGAQRIKGLSITKAVTHALRKLFKRTPKDVGQKDVETSLIERFLYPKFGPGQMWEEVAKKVIERGGEIHTRWIVEVLETKETRITGVVARNLDTNEQRRFEGDYFFSTMPVKELVRNLEAEVPADVKAVAEGLVYRDFMTVGLLVDKLKLTDSGDGKKLISDNWIYIQEPDVKVGRLQIFNNWSPYMVADPNKVWLGLEYFCNEGDELWTQTDADAMELGKAELHKIDVIDRADVVDACVHPHAEDLSGLLRLLRQLRCAPAMDRRIPEPLSRRPQRHAQVQQPGPLDADGHDRGGQHHRRPNRQGEHLAGEHRAGLPRRKGDDAEAGACRNRTPTRHRENGRRRANWPVRRPSDAIR